jgi:hypothetical protein
MMELPAGQAGWLVASPQGTQTAERSADLIWIGTAIARPPRAVDMHAVISAGVTLPAERI